MVSNFASLPFLVYLYKKLCPKLTDIVLLLLLKELLTVDSSLAEKESQLEVALNFTLLKYENLCSAMPKVQSRFRFLNYSGTPPFRHPLITDSFLCPDI